jgi:response regulator RpfG family c-di-GMP phosphodiesterase
LLDRLLAEQRITPQAREVVLNHVTATQCRMEDALVETGVLPEAFLLKWLASLHHTRFVSTERLERAEVERAVLAMVPQHIAEKHLLFPVFFDASDKSLAVVAADPDDADTLRELSLSSGASDVRAFVARPLAIRASIRKHYGGDPHAFRKMDAGIGVRSAQVEYDRGFVTERGSARVSIPTPPPPGRSSLAQRPSLPLEQRAIDLPVALVPRRSESAFDGVGDTGLLAVPTALLGTSDKPRPARIAPPPARPEPPPTPPRPPAEAVQRPSELEVVNVLVSLLESQRNELRGHSAQIARLMLKVGLHMGLPPQEVSALRLCGLLHDVGKPGNYHLTALNVAEYESHRLQAAKSYLAPVRLFDRGTLPRTTVEGISSLYERFDGQGFPDHRAGKDIPFGARLLAIVETYADLTSNVRNPFRKVLPAKAAVSVLGRYRDTLFDGNLLDVFRMAALGEEIASGILHDRPTVLVVDPDAEDTTVLELRLAEQGYAVLPCRTAEHALTRLSQGGVDFVITEAELPPRDGLAFVEQLRSARAHANVPVLVLTRRSDRTSVDRGFALGVLDYMIKPAAAEVVIAKVRNALARISPAAASRGVSGQLSEMPLPDVLQVLGRSKKTGLLRIQAGGLSGELSLGQGAIHDARFRQLRGEDAVYAMLGLSEGHFLLDPGVAPEARVVHKPLDELLLEGMRRLDETADHGATTDFAITRVDEA